MTDRISYDITTVRNARIPVRGYVVAGTPFAVRYDGGWHVDHVRTGIGVPVPPGEAWSRARAEEIARKLATVSLPWDADAKTLIKAVSSRKYVTECRRVLTDTPEPTT